MPEIVLKPGEVCPYCGQKKRKSSNGWKNSASAENGRKGGRPKTITTGKNYDSQ